MPVMAAGTQTAMRGLKMRERQTSIDKPHDQFVRHAVILDDAIRKGHARSIWAGARPTIFNGLRPPTAMMELVRVSTRADGRLAGTQRPAPPLQ